MGISQNTPKLHTQVDVEKMLREQYAIAFEDGRQAEREECVNVCIHNASDYAVFNREPYESMETGALSCAFSIRARGYTK